MTLDEARKALHEASEDLEALRYQANVAIAGKPEDAIIVTAWTIALERFRLACEAFCETARQGAE